MHRNSTQTPTEKNNVVSIFRKDSDNQKDSKKRKEEDSEERNSFLDIIRKNMDNRARMAKDRAKANQSVIRSHRLKR